MGTRASFAVIWLLASFVAIWLLASSSASMASESAPPPDYRPPDTRTLCPTLDEDYELCSDDPWSGNCGDFVAATGRLGEIYRAELRAHPGWVSGLQTTIWWGCGSAHLPELAALLEKIGTPQARAVLEQEPFRSLRAPAGTAAPVSHRDPDCLAPKTQPERDACAAATLADARAAHERAFEHCRERVSEALRGEVTGAEASWEKLLPIECGEEPFSRDLCLARAYQERTQSLSAMHPECAPER